MQKLVVATFNNAKAAEMIAILCAGLPDFDVVTLAEFDNVEEPDETGATYAENAAIKAESAARATGEMCIADDAGLEIASLPGELGLRSRRFAGTDTPFEEKMRLVLARIGEERSAVFRCCVALARPGQPTKIFKGETRGVITKEPRGENGFGYDPIFVLPKLGKTMAELTREEKARISHRGQALRAVIERLSLRTPHP